MNKAHPASGSHGETPYRDTHLDRIFDELFPICRSITGPGLRASLDIFGKYMPLRREFIPTGTQIFDWTVPPEWHIHSATLTGPDGTAIADFSEHNLHIVNYSEPVNRKLALDELRPKLHSLPQLPTAIPYVTSYYQRDWGFCLPHNTVETLMDGLYHARIDSEYIDGGVDIAHCKLEGESEREILLSSYLCHPSMANNELSGPLVLLGLYHRLRSWKRRRYTYRFVLHPETIGSLCFLHLYQEHLRENLEAGLVLTCLGGPREGLSYKLSRSGEGLLDRVILHQSTQGQALRIRPFTPVYGSDERQYCSPGFNFPVGNIAKTPYAAYSGYHTSLDNKDFMGIDSIIDSIDRIEQLLINAETGSTYINKSPYGEPQLSKYNLYPSTNSAHAREKSSDDKADGRKRLELILHTLSHCDGRQSMVELASQLDIDLDEFRQIVEILEDNGLIEHRQPE